MNASCLDCVAQLHSVVAARFSIDGELLDANAGFERLVAGSRTPPWYLFTLPHLDDLVAVGAAGDAVRHRGPITIGDPEGVMRTLHGTIRVEGDELIIFAGFDIDELERANDLLLELNAELDAAQRDIVRAKRELTRSEERFRIAARITAEVIWEWNLASDRVWWDGTVVDRFGYNPEDLTDAATWLEIVHPDDRDRVRNGIRPLTEAKAEEWTDEFRLRHADGSDIQVLCRARAVRDESGRTARIIGTTMDITERRRVEAAIRKAEQLESLARLSGGIAHEFNNLLTIILGNIELLSGSLSDNRDLLAFTDSTRTAAERAAKLTQRLLGFSRQQSLQPEPTDIAAMVRAVVADAGRNTGGGIRIHIDASPDLAPVAVDAAQLETVLRDLIDNATSAMPDGGELSICLARASAFEVETLAPGDYVRLGIRDTGTGMSRAILDRVFDPFFTTREVGEGVGLGLSMAYGFARQSGGALQVESAPGAGTTVRLILPSAAQQ